MAATNKPADKKTAEVKAVAPKAEAKKEVKAVAPKAEEKKEVKAAAPKAEAKKVEAPKAEKKVVAPKAEKKAAAPKAAKKVAAPKAEKKAAAPKAVVASFESIFTAVEAKAKKAKFTSDFMATQITLKGNLECQPLYVKVESKKAEVAPYEYNNACFYIDADAETFAAILNGKKSIYDALATGAVTINGDATKAILFVKVMF